MMTKAQLDWLAAYVKEVRDFMVLQAWRIDIIDAPPPAEYGDVRAVIGPTDNRNHAALWVTRAFLESDADEQRQTIVHELVHIAAREQNDTIRQNGLSNVLGTTAYLLVWESFQNAHERLADHLADVIAPFAPKPSAMPKDA